MGPGQGALLRQCGLRTFLETAAVSHAPEDAGDELRVVHIAEAVEDLVLVAEVEVHPGVKGVAIFADRRRSGEVGRYAAARRGGIQIQQLDGICIQTPGRQDVQVASC